MLVFAESYIEGQHGWIEALVAPIATQPNAITFPLSVAAMSMEQENKKKEEERKKERKKEINK